MNLPKLQSIIIALVIGMVWIIIGIGILLYAGVLVFPSSNFSFQQSTSVPIQGNAKGVKAASISYTVTSRVVALKKLNDKDYVLTLSDYPGQNISVSAGQFVGEMPPKSDVHFISQVSVGDTITISLIYNLQSQSWLAAPPINPAQVLEGRQFKVNLPSPTRSAN